jgi:hypothetical protein
MEVVKVNEREIEVSGKKIKVLRENDIPSYCLNHPIVGTEAEHLEESKRTKRPYGQREVQV